MRFYHYRPLALSGEDGHEARPLLVAIFGPLDSARRCSPAERLSPARVIKMQARFARARFAVWNRLPQAQPLTTSPYGRQQG